MSKATIFRHYSQALADAAQHRDAREESYYPALGHLVDEVAQATHHADVSVTILPRPTEAGNPDFRVWDGAQHVTGYIEAKAPTARPAPTARRTRTSSPFAKASPSASWQNREDRALG